MLVASRKPSCQSSLNAITKCVVTYGHKMCLFPEGKMQTYKRNTQTRNKR